MELDDVLWVLAFGMPDDRLGRHLHAWCVEQNLALFETHRPTDNRVRDQIATLRNDDASEEERCNSRAAARQAFRDASDNPVAAWVAKAAAWRPEDAVAGGTQRADVALTWAGGMAASQQETQLRRMLET